MNDDHDDDDHDDDDNVEILQESLANAKVSARQPW